MKAWAIYYYSEGQEKMEVVASVRKPSVERALKLADLDWDSSINNDEVLVTELIVYSGDKKYTAELKEVEQ